MPSLLTEPGFDTWLARLLHQLGRVDVATLQTLLAETRSDRRRTLAQAIADRGLLTTEELEARLNELLVSESLGPPPQHAGSVPWRPGAVVDGYTLEAKLGEGGMGVVYRARHAETGASYAMKTLLDEADAELVLRFQREGEAQARSDTHPNVVRVHSAGQAEGRHYLIMDLAEGGDLQSRLEAEPLNEGEAVRIVLGLARGLAWLHSVGVLHRDLKPANVLFDEAGTPKLVDFGLARLADAQSLTQTGAIMGSPSYMAPEQAEGRRESIGPPTDIYGLGGILYTLLTGRPPFNASSPMGVLVQVIQDTPVPPRDLNPTVPAALERICLRCLEKDPARRYASADEFAEALEAYLRGEAPGTGTRLSVVLGGGLLGLLGVVLAAVLWPSSAPTPVPIPVPIPVPTPPPVAEVPNDPVVVPNSKPPAPGERLTLDDPTDGEKGRLSYFRESRFGELYVLAERHELAGEYPKALAAVQAAMREAKNEKDYNVGLLFRCKIYGYMFREWDGIAELTQSIEAQPTVFKLQQRGLLYIRVGRYDLAREDLAAIARFDGDGQIEARDALRAAIDARVESRLSSVRLVARVDAGLGASPPPSHAELLELFQLAQDAVGADDKYDLAHYARARVLMELGGRENEVLESLSHAAQKSPKRFGPKLKAYMERIKKRGK